MKKYFDSDGNELNFGDTITVSHSYVHKGVRCYTKFTGKFDEDIAKSLIEDGFITEKEVEDQKEEKESISMNDIFDVFNDVFKEFVNFIDGFKQKDNKCSTK